jgi:general secretion pathway protein N
MRRRYYILTGIVAYFIFLITTIPAAPVIDLFGDRIPASINNISGTLWDGQAGSITTNKNLTLNNIEWSFLPLHLLAVSIAVDVNAEFNDKPLTTRLSTGLSGKLVASDLSINLDASDITPLIALPFGELSGEFNLAINKAVLEQGSVPQLDGTINWNRAAVTIAETAELGNVSILLNEDDDSPLNASISNKGGQLTLNGNLTTTAQGDYTLQLKMKPNANASDNLVSSLAMFSKKQRNGEFLLNNKGNLKQLGLM